jgi:DNA-binding transcriptional LysR family regulator
MTQSGVSQHIRKLETQIRQQLLIRHGKQFTLTEAGSRLYKEGRLVLQSFEDLEQYVKYDPAYEGQVSIMSPGSLGLKLYPHLLAMQKSYPKLNIDYRFAPNLSIEDAISSSKVDIGFMTDKTLCDEIVSQEIGKEALFLITPADVYQPNWQQLLQLGFIDHPDGAHHANLLLSVNFSAFHHCNQFIKKGFSNQINLILEPVSLGLGFTVLPAYAVEAFNKPELIKVHKLKIPVFETLYLCTHRGKPLANRMFSVIKETKKWL